MKAIVQDAYGSSDVLRLAEIDRPRVGEHDVLVRVKAAGIDQGVWHVMAGQPYLVRAMGYGLRAPKNPVRGLDLAGQVAAVGARVTAFALGDEVFGTCDGSLAEYASTNAENLTLKPANLTFEQAAAIPTSGFAALQGLRDRGHLEAGEHVLIIGAGGGVGTFAVQIAKAFGAHVTGVCSPGKTVLVRALGADDVIDYTREEFTDGRRRYDLILDTAGHRPLSQLRRALMPGGTLVLVGSEVTGRWLGGVDRQLRALLLSPFVSTKLRGLVSNPRPADLELLRQLAQDGKVAPAIDRAFPLDRAPDAIRYLRAGRARGKVVVTVAADAGNGHDRRRWHATAERSMPDAPETGAFAAGGRLASWLHRISNPVVALVLRSPLHRLLSGSLLLLIVQGRRTGRRYTFPVQYLRVGQTLYVVPGNHEHKTWWRNLRTPAEVRVRLQGRDLEAVGQVFLAENDPELVADAMRMYMQRFPSSARLRGLTIGDGEIAEDGGLLQAATAHDAIVRVELPSNAPDVGGAGDGYR